jgi:hypothetical protein
MPFRRRCAIGPSTAFRKIRQRGSRQQLTASSSTPDGASARAERNSPCSSMKPRLQAGDPTVPETLDTESPDDRLRLTPTCCAGSARSRRQQTRIGERSRQWRTGSSALTWNAGWRHFESLSTYRRWPGVAAAMPAPDSLGAARPIREKADDRAVTTRGQRSLLWFCRARLVAPSLFRRFVEPG